MKNIFNYISNNSFLISIIGILIGWLLSTLTTIIVNKGERKHKKEEDLRREKKNQFENKAELHIEKNIEDNGQLETIKIFLTDFEAKVEKNDVKFYYRNGIKDKNKYKHTFCYIKNIGKADINFLDICVTSQKHLMLCDIDLIDTMVLTNFINYNCCYDRKILKNEIIKIDIAYLKDSKIANLLSSELELIFRDSYGNLYAQPFFIQRNNIYPPRIVDESYHKLMISTNTAIECFKNPLMW